MEIDGIRMLIGLVIGITLLIMLVLKTKVQTFLALIISTIVIGLIGGMPLTATDVVDAAGDARAGVSIINSITSGFGGTLGSIGIITDSGLGGYIANGLAGSNIPLILLPLAISTLMRFIQGSGTVAMTTAASITAPILIASDAVSPVLGAIACCVGSLFFGYFNDSYFWVVNRTLGVSDGGDQLRVWSATSTIAWAVGVVEVLILSIFMH